MANPTVVTYSGVTFYLAGSREAAMTGYLQTLSANAGWQAQLAIMVASGRTNVVISDRITDFPLSNRTNLYNGVYSQPVSAEGTGEVGGYTSEPGGTNVAHILLNSGTGTRASAIPGSTEILTRDPFVIFVHEVFHVGRVGTGLHPTSWTAPVDAVLSAFGFGTGINAARSPRTEGRKDVAYNDPNPLLDLVTPQTSGIPTAAGSGSSNARDDATRSIIDGAGNVISDDARLPDGSYSWLDNDIAGLQPWTTRTSIASAAGVISATTFVVGASDTGTITGTAGITNTIQASVSQTLGTNINNLTLTGTAAINGTGNTLANVITGNEAINTLNGGDGNDTLNGLGGNDILLGGNGNDTLTGGAGADNLQGGVGDDTYYVDAADAIIEAAGAGTDTIVSDASYTLVTNVENLTLIGTGATNGTGNTLDNLIVGNEAANVLYGLAGNDVIYGLGGNDTIVGGDGNDNLIGGAGADNLQAGLGDDVYQIDSADTVIEAANAGSDTVYAGFSYAVGVNIENAVLTGSANINATGSAGNNILVGNSGNNTLSGGDGNDNLSGGAGSDTLLGGNGNDTLWAARAPGSIPSPAATASIRSSI